jgi:pyridoxamine 5'-phosphate oxidase
MSSLSLQQIRREYQKASLEESSLPSDPLEYLQRWLQEAIAAQLPEPTAMVLATATPEGAPSARVMLLKGIEDGALVFYTNYESRKAQELERNPRAAVVLFWAELERQVRVEGTVERLPAEVSAAYFRTRPREAQLAAWSSPQSRVIPDRAFLEARFQAIAQQYQQQEVPCPPFWGGYRLLPHTVEFWQGRPHRLHDRIRYRRHNGQWLRERLAP